MSENEEILDQLTCPICFLYPEKEVFQCRNGHPICSSCIQPLNTCPQCKLHYGKSPIRCRLMESLLQSVKLICAYKDFGCTQRFLRKDLAVHHEVCEFRSVSLCKWMGYECNFKASTVPSLIQHLESCHNALGVLNYVMWKTFSSAHKSREVYLKECDALSDSQSSKTWFLFLVTRSTEPNEEKLFSCVPIHLHDGQCTAQHEVHLELYNQGENRLLYKWVGHASNYKGAQKDFLYPPFRIIVNNMMKQALKFSQLTQFDLTLQFTVKVKPIPSIEQRTTN